MCLIIKICKCLLSKYTNVSNFHPPGVVGHGSEITQVGENLNYLIEQFKV